LYSAYCILFYCVEAPVVLLHQGRWGSRPPSSPQEGRGGAHPPGLAGLPRLPALPRTFQASHGSQASYGAPKPPSALPIGPPPPPPHPKKKKKKEGRGWGGRRFFFIIGGGGVTQGLGISQIWTMEDTCGSPRELNGIPTL